MNQNLEPGTWNLEPGTGNGERRAYLIKKSIVPTVRSHDMTIDARVFVTSTKLIVNCSMLVGEFASRIGVRSTSNLGS